MEDMKGMALVCGIPHERFSELYWKLRPPYDRGDIDGPAYWTAVVGQQELGLSRDQIATLIKLDSESITDQIKALCNGQSCCTMKASP